MKSIKADLFGDLRNLYGESQGREVYAEIEKKIGAFQKSGKRLRHLDQRDVFLITYGDQFQAGGRQEKPLQTLLKFSQKWLQGLINTIHILPFYPSSSDDGFAVLDYRRVNPEWGGWQDVEQIGGAFCLMFDLVINHVSAGSRWFQDFLAGREPYVDFFITPPAGANLQGVIRPRTSPLLMPVQTHIGERRVWTTFSPDQVDLNYHNPRVLLAMLDVILDYASYGASYLRLDAIAYLWKEIGSECLNLPQTHLVVQIIRRFLDLTAPHIRLITETNIPHFQNISYFGDGRHEAQLVYNFALPPLVLYALLSGQVDELREWARTLATPTDETFFFNFLASHDGIGLNPARGILTDEKIAFLVKSVEQHGGLVSYKSMADGSSIPYELNVNYFDALSDPSGGESLAQQTARFLVSQAVLLALKGAPAVYVHSLLGSRGWPEGPALTGQNRSINRQKFQVEALEQELSEPSSLRQRVFKGYKRLLQARTHNPAFSPAASQTVLSTGSQVFSLLRRDEKSGRAVVCCHNFSAEPQTFTLPEEACASLPDRPVNLIDGQEVFIAGRKVPLAGYQIAWLSSKRE